MNRLLLACGVLATSGAMVWGQQPAPRVDPASLQGSVPIELVFLRDQGPLLVRLHALQEGQPLQARWQQYVERWFDYLDRKKSGALDEADLMGAPNAASMRNLVVQRSFFPNRGLSATPGDFGKAAGETVAKAEFLEYYRKNGINPMQAAGAPVETTLQANDALFKTLDANSDGRLSRVELESGRLLLTKLDLDDDELVSFRELAPAVGQPVRGGVQFVQQPGIVPKQQLQGTSFIQLSADTSRAGLATLLLARYDKKKRLTVTQKDIGLDDDTFKRLDVNRNGNLDLVELANFPKNGPAVELVVNVRAAGQTPPLAIAKTGALMPEAIRWSAGTLSFALGDADISVQNLDAGPTRLVPNQFNAVAQQLKAADTKSRGYVELDDLQGQQFQFLRTLFPVLDRNEDGKLTEAEGQAYFDLQGQVRDVTTSFYVQEQGRNWFQILDANRDGQLSPRELLTAWTRLAVRDKNGDGVIDADELPMQFRVVFNPVNQGAAAFMQVGGGGAMTGPGRGDGNYPANTPSWFRKMDRNRDGDVSRREFLGAREDFDRLDRNRDSLLDADEAAAATAQR